MVRSLLLSLLLSYACVATAADDNAVWDTQAWRDGLVKVGRLRDKTNAEKIALLRRQFDAGKQRLPALRDLSTEELRNAFGAADLMFSYALIYGDAAFRSDVEDVSAAFDELTRRNAATQAEANAIRGVWLATWNSKKVADIQGRFPELPAVTAPQLDDDVTDLDAPSYVDFGKGGPQAVVHTPDLTQGVRIVVVSGCKNAERAADAVEADPELRRAFGRAGALWIEPASKDIDVENIHAWNATHPDHPMMVAVSNAAWSGFDFARIPTVYVMVDGKIVAAHRGWNVDGSAPSGLRASLRDVGLLPD